MYGLDDPQEIRALINNNDEWLMMFGEANIPGRFLVNVLPWLKHVPSWVPGAGFQHFFERLRRAANSTKVRPFMEVKARLVCRIRDLIFSRRVFR